MDNLAALVDRAKAGDRLADDEILARAGAGCIEAQRAIRDHLLSGETCPESMMAAMVPARMIAARGTTEDRHKFGSIMFVLALGYRHNGNSEVAVEYAEDALSVFRKLADEGDGIALQMLAAMGPEFPVLFGAMEQAQPAADVGRPVTAIEPPPVITTFAPLHPMPLPLRTRLAIWWGDVSWSVRLWWWNFSARWGF